MKARIILLLVWYGILLAIVGTVAATADGAPQRLPHLSQIARAYVPEANVYSVRFSTGWDGEARRPGTILLAPDVVSALRQAPRVVTPAYPRSNSGWAVFVLAHEIGHLVGQDGGEWEEARADCWAASHWRQIARRLGYRSAQLPRLAQLIDAGIGAGTCWGPYAKT